jgi:predicted nucleic acid-binding Zn ribbon protein
MSEAHVGPLPEGMKHCRVCAEPINKAAQKCIHCQSEQSTWRQRLGFSSTVLALLIALISVLSSAVPVFERALTPKDSHLSFAYLGATEDSIGILVSNSGNRPGAVRYATLQGSSSDLIHLGVYASGFRATQIVGAGENIEVDFYKRDRSKIDPIGGDCIITVVYKNFVGPPEETTLKAPCLNFRAFLQNTRD